MEDPSILTREDVDKAVDYLKDYEPPICFCGNKNAIFETLLGEFLCQECYQEYYNKLPSGIKNNMILESIKFLR